MMTRMMGHGGVHKTGGSEVRVRHRGVWFYVVLAVLAALTTAAIALFVVDWRRASALARIALPAQEPIAGTQVPSLAGNYRVTGTGPVGAYTGTALIEQRGRSVFVQWTVPEGSYQGFGLIVGDILSVSYACEGVGGVGCVVVYRIAEGRLTGEWPNYDGSVWQESMVKTSEEQASPLLQTNKPRLLPI